MWNPEILAYIREEFSKNFYRISIAEGREKVKIFF